MCRVCRRFRGIVKASFRGLSFAGRREEALELTGGFPTAYHGRNERAEGQSPGLRGGLLPCLERMVRGMEEAKAQGPLSPFRWLLLFVALGAGICPPAGAQGLTGVGAPSPWPAPELVRVSDDDLLLNDPYTRGFRSRFWYFNGLLEGGTTFAISLFQWRHGLLGGPGLAVLVSEPGRPALALETRIDERSFVESPQRLDIRFGDSELTGSRDGSTVRLRLPEFSCDLEIRNLLNPWRPGDGTVRLSPGGGAYTRHTVLSPFATVSGRMSFGGREMAAQGFCYSDRGLVNLPLRRLNPEEFSFRVFGPGITPEEEPWMVSVLESVSAEAYGSRRTSSLLVGRGRQWILATDGHSFEATDFVLEQGAAFPYPRRLKVRATKNGYALDGEFVVNRLIALDDILAKLPPVFREVAELLIRRPVIHRLGGYFLGSLECPDGTREILCLPGQGDYSLFR
jgi:hypothetical protein